MTADDDIAQRLDDVRARIARACDNADREPGSVTLVAVSKGHGPDRVRVAYEAGQRVFGENYAQEFEQKVTELRDLSDIQWRFIGHLQRNKAKLVVPMSFAVDTVDSVRLAQTLDQQAHAHDKRLDVLAQVNVAGEPQKSGCLPKDLPEVVEALRHAKRLDFRGLMTIAPLGEAPEAAAPHFARLAALAAEHGLEALSMGMTDDLEVAIREGATIVRVGTAIFGSRA